MCGNDAPPVNSRLKKSGEAEGGTLLDQGGESLSDKANRSNLGAPDVAIDPSDLGCKRKTATMMKPIRGIRSGKGGTEGEKVKTEFFKGAVPERF